MSARFHSFAEFYPFYLSEHRHPISRRMHFAGTLLVVACVALAILTANFWWLAAVPVFGYGFAWIGHFFFEHNTPATWKNPVYAFRADLNMTWDVLRGRIKL